MSKGHYYFIFNPRRCFGCNGCVSACKNVNNYNVKNFWRNVYKIIPESGNNNTLFISLSCNHCKNPSCVKACPAAALFKREDGIVLHDKDKCLGCRYCQMACPYDAIKWDEEEKVVQKCDFCHKKLDSGEEPACVQTCFGEALQFHCVKDKKELDGLKKDIPGFIHIEKNDPAIRFTLDIKKKFIKGNNK